MRTLTKTTLMLCLFAMLSGPTIATAGGLADLIRIKSRHTVSDGVASALGHNAKQATHQGIQTGLKKLFGAAPQKAPQANPETKPAEEPVTDEKR